MVMARCSNGCWIIRTSSFGFTRTISPTDGISAQAIPIYTGPIERLLRYRFGRLPYRSLRFEHKHLPAQIISKPLASIANEQHAYTRITELKHLTGQEHEGTSIAFEYPQAVDPFYPIPRPENERLYARYRELQGIAGDTSLRRQVAQYRYYNMGPSHWLRPLTACKSILGEQMH